MSKSDSRIMLRFRRCLGRSFLGLWIFSAAVIPCFGQLTYQQIRTLPAGDAMGSATTDDSMGEKPIGPLIEGSDGKLYGTMVQSGFPGVGGAVFRVNKDGSAYVALCKFGLVPNDCSNSWAGLV